MSNFILSNENFTIFMQLTNRSELVSPGNGLVVLEKPVMLHDDQLHNLDAVKNTIQ
jgi:hypothetical protein